MTGNFMRRREFITVLGGAAAAWPLAARAQQPKMPIVGFLNTLVDVAPNNGPGPLIRAGLADAGFIEGKNLSIENRSAANFRQLQEMAGDLVGRQVAVIVTFPSLVAARVAMAATSTIPIVFFYAGDPVREGLVASLNRPGANVTGMTTLGPDLASKRLDLLLQMVPQAKKIGYPVGRSLSVGAEETTSMLAAGRALGVEIMTLEYLSNLDLVTKMVEGRVGAMIVGNNVISETNITEIAALALVHKIPAIYPGRSVARAGGLMSYASDGAAMTRRLGSAYVARILRGDKPADLPVELPTRFELVVNLWAAKALGLNVPYQILTLADEVIE